MAKWGRRGLRFRSFGGGMWTGRPLKRVKTVSWGSKTSASTTSSSGAKWGARAGGSRGKWGKRTPSLSFGAGMRNRSSSNSGGPPGAWGGRPARPRMRRRNFWLIALIVMTLLSIQSFVYIERNLRPPLMNIAKIRVKQVATQAINKAITDQVANQSESDKLIDWKMNSNGKISGFILNYAEHMKITSQTVSTVENTLKDMEDIPEHIPIGHALNSAIISSFGPRVPVKFEPVGAAKVELSTREKDVAINMVLVEVYIRITAEVTIIIPFDTEPELVETEIPISYLLVVGDVPMYYYDNTGKPVGDSAGQAPNISVPLSPGSGVSIQGEDADNKDSGESDASGNASGGEGAAGDTSGEHGNNSAGNAGNTGAE
ncbi:sporulation protein YunB [Paenibacillus harenae]|uniref:Sporulation protein YunB n=1 Tax=Paenibacillus harenae TaxID=306543 RepID=A0ABT9TUX9_PAEHA|nr:sporulation protein YunB [Paenibacillus harenae]MDQ0060940.1 sporulation protein YunB [Paenibacillus harenae]MDQ0111171.1 sporulation protein YunB [Paenibacillus harenae]